MRAMKNAVSPGVLAIVVAVLLAQAGGVGQQPSTDAGADWPMYRRDRAGTGFSPLTDINAAQRRRR